MHNCKTTRRSLVDLALEESRESSRPLTTAAGRDESAGPRAELSVCSACRAEYASLRRTLSTVHQATEAASPAESFWPGYHSRLTARLKNAATDTTRHALPARSSFHLWSILKTITGASVRIPVPVAAIILLLFGLSMFLLRQRSGPATPEPRQTAIAVETRTVEVPVFKEKVVTRVVYVARNPTSTPAQPGNTLTASSATAPTPQESAGKSVFNLADFKPPEQVKLTIIKGSYHDEK
jgi:hypothetical protein